MYCSLAFYDFAESGSYLALGWLMPERVLDLFVEHRCLTKGIPTGHGNGLLGALAASPRTLWARCRRRVGDAAELHPVSVDTTLSKQDREDRGIDKDIEEADPAVGAVGSEGARRSSTPSMARDERPAARWRRASGGARRATRCCG